MTTAKLFRFARMLAVVLLLLPVFGAAIADDDLSGSQEQTQVQVPDANPMQEPEQIEEAQNIERVPQTDEVPSADESDEIEESEAPPISQ